MIYLIERGTSVSWRFGNVLDEKTYGISLRDVTEPGASKFGMGWTTVMSVTANDKYDSSKKSGQLQTMDFIFGQATKVGTGKTLNVSTDFTYEERQLILIYIRF